MILCIASLLFFSLSAAVIAAAPVNELGVNLAATDQVVLMGKIFFGAFTIGGAVALGLDIYLKLKQIRTERELAERFVTTKAFDEFRQSFSERLDGIHKKITDALNRADARDQKVEERMTALIKATAQLEGAVHGGVNHG